MSRKETKIPPPPLLIFALLLRTMVVGEEQQHQQQRIHSRQKRLLWITSDGRLALPPGTTMVIAPSLSLPFVRYPPDGFFSNMTISLPFTSKYKGGIGIDLKSTRWHFLSICFRSFVFQSILVNWDWPITRTPLARIRLRWRVVSAWKLAICCLITSAIIFYIIIVRGGVNVTCRRLRLRRRQCRLRYRNVTVTRSTAARGRSSTWWSRSSWTISVWTVRLAYWGQSARYIRVL